MNEAESLDIINNSELDLKSIFNSDKITTQNIKELNEFSFNNVKYKVVGKVFREYILNNVNDQITQIDDLFNKGGYSFYLNFFENEEINVYGFSKVLNIKSRDNAYLFVIILYTKNTGLNPSNCVSTINDEDENFTNDMDDGIDDEFIQITYGFRERETLGNNKAHTISYDQIVDLSSLFENLRKTPSNYLNCKILLFY